MERRASSGEGHEAKAGEKHSEVVTNPVKCHGRQGQLKTEKMSITTEFIDNLLLGKPGSGRVQSPVGGGAGGVRKWSAEDSSWPCREGETRAG